jgi:uncharacterized membrane protein
MFPNGILVKAIPLCLKESDMQDIDLFLGRFHPLVVHLPIGFLVLGLAFEFLARQQKLGMLKPALPVIYLLAAVAATLSLILGFFLAREGGYGTEAIELHRNLGILLTVFCWLLWLTYFKSFNRLQIPLAILAGVLLIFTGHFGGNLTHGSTYLTEYMPFRKSDEIKLVEIPANFDSVMAFTHLVQPILNEKCVSCHNSDKQKGGLLMTSFSAIVDGGETGKTLINGDPGASELYRRVTLDPHHDEFMPPDGKTPLASEEVEIIRWWIAAGCPNQEKLAMLPINALERETITRHLGIGSDSPDNWPEVEPVAPELIARLQKSGFRVNPLAQDIPYLEVDYNDKQPLTENQIAILAEAAPQIAWLYLNESGLKGPELKSLEKFPNLRKLRLDNNNIDETHLQALTSLENLEYLNLYGTRVTDKLLDVLKKMPRLRKVYLWQTQVNEESAAEFRQERPEVELVFGI